MPANRDQTINEAVKAAMDDWKRNGTLNVDVMRESIDQLVDEAMFEWCMANPDATENEPEEAIEPAVNELNGETDPDGDAMGRMMGRNV